MKTSIALFTLVLVGFSVSVSAQTRESRFGLADLDYGQWDFQQAPPPSRAPAKVDWSSPPLACVEDLVPVKPDRPCLDLTRVADPRTDWPTASPDDLKYWKETKRPVQYCRALEVERREAATPGTYSPFAMQLAWLQIRATENPAEKTRAIYAASRDYKVPAHVLTGALYQESLIAEIGISPDGNNYSCGIGQFNLIGWCSWANGASDALKAKLGWPLKGIKCDSLQRAFVAPFYDLAATKMGSEPLYKMNATQFADIQLQDVEKRLPPANADIQQTRYQAVMSFVGNCMSAEYGIRVKARELGEIYARYVPAGLKAQEVVTASKKSKLVCQEKGSEETFPLQTAWLLAVGAYNSGPTAVDLMAFYNQFSSDELKLPSTFSRFEPRELVTSLYWGGRYNANTDQIDFRTRANKAISWSWFRQCVVQRHVARIIQHVARPGAPSMIESLEGPGVCAKSQIDPATGKVILSGVPAARQTSSGVK